MGALSGIRVLDLGVLVQAPQAALLLGDMGASVKKLLMAQASSRIDAESLLNR